MRTGIGECLKNVEWFWDLSLNCFYCLAVRQFDCFVIRLFQMFNHICISGRLAKHFKKKKEDGILSMSEFRMKRPPSLFYCTSNKHTAAKYNTVAGYGSARRAALSAHPPSAQVFGHTAAVFTADGRAAVFAAGLREKNNMDCRRGGEQKNTNCCRGLDIRFSSEARRIKRHVFTGKTSQNSHIISVQPKEMSKIKKNPHKICCTFDKKMF